MPPPSRSITAMAARSATTSMTARQMGSLLVSWIGMSIWYGHSRTSMTPGSEVTPTGWRGALAHDGATAKSIAAPKSVRAARRTKTTLIIGDLGNEGDAQGIVRPHSVPSSYSRPTVLARKLARCPEQQRRVNGCRFSVISGRNPITDDREPTAVCPFFIDSVVPSPLPSPADIRAAALRIAPRIRRTPLRRSTGLSEFLGGDAWLKLECEQVTGSFKLRGATNALALLDERARATGVVASSAGNHGLGIAAAAKELGVAATVFVPRTAPAA